MAEALALTEAVFYILLALLKPMHGYGIMQTVEKMSGGRVRLAAGTLYGALNALVEKGWITLLPGEGRKKEYRLTPMGLEILKKELARLRELVASGDMVLKEEV